MFQDLAVLEVKIIYYICIQKQKQKQITEMELNKKNVYESLKNLFLLINE